MTSLYRAIARHAYSFALCASMVFCVSCLEATAAEPTGRVLYIGIDGCRFDALQKAEAPHLDRLRNDGCYSDRTLIHGTRYQGSDTVSGPGWSSLLTGVWADKHGVQSNRFEQPHYDRYPHFFRRVKEAYPKARTCSIAAWPPIPDKIVSAADVNERPPTVDRYVPGDRDTANSAVNLLRHDAPTVAFAYFGQVDEHGHSFGFSPDVPEYVAAIERVDAHVGELLKALWARPKFTEENWIVIVSSDHGGRGKDHGGGRGVPEIMNSFVIVHGAAAAKGRIAEQTYLVDVPVSALHHIGVKIDPKWELDGQPIGLQAR